MLDRRESANAFKRLFNMHTIQHYQYPMPFPQLVSPQRILSTGRRPKLRLCLLQAIKAGRIILFTPKALVIFKIKVIVMVSIL